MRNIIFLLSAVLIAQAQTIRVDVNAPPGGDGSPQHPFNTLPAAIVYANSLNKAPVIQIAPGTYELSDTVRIERGMTLHGSSQLEYDDQDLPTGNLIDPARETRIVSSAGFSAPMMIYAGKPGQVIRDVKLRNLTLQAGPTNPGVLDLARVQRFEVRDCILKGQETLPSRPPNGINTFASSGTIHHIFVTRMLASAFLGAGYPESPGRVSYHHNRSIRNRIGLYLIGTSDGITEPGDQLYADIFENDLSENFEQRPSAGVRITIKGIETLGPGYGGTGLATGNVHATFRNNRLVHNKTGVEIDGGFVTRLMPPPPPDVCDTRTFSGLMDLTFRNNELSGSTFVPALITFTQVQVTLGIAEGNPPNYTGSQFLHFTTYDILDPQGSLTGAYIQHPATDPFVGGPCAADVVHEPLGNTLLINGSIVANTAP